MRLARLRSVAAPTVMFSIPLDIDSAITRVPVSTVSSSVFSLVSSVVLCTVCSLFQHASWFACLSISDLISAPGGALVLIVLLALSGYMISQNQAGHIDNRTVHIDNRTVHIDESTVHIDTWYAAETPSPSSEGKEPSERASPRLLQHKAQASPDLEESGRETMDDVAEVMTSSGKQDGRRARQRRANQKKREEKGGKPCPRQAEKRGCSSTCPYLH